METQNQRVAREIAQQFGGGWDLQKAILDALEAKDAAENEDRARTAATAIWACSHDGTCHAKRPMPRQAVKAGEDLT